jgi:hypothetical protein
MTVMDEKTGKPMTPVKALMTYMSQGKHARKCNLAEMKELTMQERAELGQQALIALEKGWD